MMHSLRVLSYLEHFKVTDEGVAGGEVVPKHHDAPAGLAPHVAEAVVGEVGDPGPGGDVDPAVRAHPALGTQTHTWESCRPRWPTEDTQPYLEHRGPPRTHSRHAEDAPDTQPCYDG